MTTKKTAADLMGDDPPPVAPDAAAASALPQPAPVGTVLRTVTSACFICGAEFPTLWSSKLSRCKVCHARDGELSVDAWFWIRGQADTLAAYRDALRQRHPAKAKAIDPARLDLPPIFAAACPNQDVERWAKEAVADTGPRLLTLLGPPGTGKTWQACGALKAIAARTKGGLCMLLPAVRLGRPGDLLDRARDAGALVLDDLGARLSHGALATAYEIIDHRIAHRLPLIVTSNVALGDLNDLDARLASRLGSGLVMQLRGEDRRLAR